MVFPIVIVTVFEVRIQQSALRVICTIKEASLRGKAAHHIVQTVQYMRLHGYTSSVVPHMQLSITPTELSSRALLSLSMSFPVLQMHHPYPTPYLCPPVSLSLKMHKHHIGLFHKSPNHLPSPRHRRSIYDPMIRAPAKVHHIPLN